MTEELKPNVIISFEDAQRLFDVAVNSMDFGSGFLETDDVDVLRKVAKLIDVDPMVATPYNFKKHYKHPFKLRLQETIRSLEEWLQTLEQRHILSHPTYPGLGRPLTEKDMQQARYQVDWVRNTCAECGERIKHEVHS